MAFNRYARDFGVLWVAFIGVFVILGAKGYKRNMDTRYPSINIDGYSSSTYRRVNEPAFSIKNNLKSLERNFNLYLYDQSDNDISSSDIFKGLENNAISFAGGQQQTVHEPRAAIVPIPAHTPRPVHVVEPRPHHAVKVEPASEQKEESKSTIDPFKDKEAKEKADKEEKYMDVTKLEAEEKEHNLRCHSENPTGYHNVNLNLWPCKEVAAAAPLQFFEHGDEKKYRGAFIWWLLPLIIFGLLLIAILLALFFWQKRPSLQPRKKFVIEKRTKEEDEDDIEAEIQRQLKAKAESQAPRKILEEIKREDIDAGSSGPPEKETYLASNVNNIPGETSSKKVVKKRIVKMMKDGKLVAEKEEILDEEGNVLRTQFKKDH